MGVSGGWLWLLGLLAGYGLFMFNHPLRAEFSAGFRHARTHSWLILSLAIFLIFDVLYRFWQGISLTHGNTPEIMGWQWLLPWIASLVEDLRSLFWFSIPLNSAFLIGTPLAAACSGFWMGRLWRALPNSQRWILFVIIATLVLALWWWWEGMLMILGVPYSLVPSKGPLMPMLRVSGEWVWAILFSVFVQLVFLLNAYRTHVAKNGRSPARDTLGWTLKCFPYTITVPLIALLGVAAKDLIDPYLEPQGRTIWSGVSLALLVTLSAIPISLLLLRDVKWTEALRASFSFLKRTAWSYAWFLFIVIIHFMALHAFDRYLLNLSWIENSHLLTWHIVAAFIRAGLVVWFLHAFCIYFCIDVQGPKTKADHPGPRNTMNFRKLHVRR